MDIGLLEHIVDIITEQSIIKYSTYIEISETDRYRYNLRVYGGHTNVVQQIHEILPGGHQVFPWGVLSPLLSCPPTECVITPGPIPLGAVTSYSCSGIY